MRPTDGVQCRVAWRNIYDILAFLQRFQRPIDEKLLSIAYRATANIPFQFTKLFQFFFRVIHFSFEMKNFIDGLHVIL